MLFVKVGKSRKWNKNVFLKKFQIAQSFEHNSNEKRLPLPVETLSKPLSFQILPQSYVVDDYVASVVVVVAAVASVVVADVVVGVAEDVVAQGEILPLDRSPDRRQTVTCRRCSSGR